MQAVKILWFEKIRKKYFIKQKQLIQMVNAETNLLLKLRHPHIIQFKEAIYAAEKERMFIVLEYCSQGSLLSILHNRLTVEDNQWHQEVRGYFKQMVEAIALSTDENIQCMRTILYIGISNLRTCLSMKQACLRSSTSTSPKYVFYHLVNKIR